jgi:hypothetical protein
MTRTFRKVTTGPSNRNLIRTNGFSAWNTVGLHFISGLTMSLLP